MPTIHLESLFVMVLPLLVVGYFYFRWTDKVYEIPYATLRMVGQLLMVGYLLSYIFASEDWLLGSAIILFMIIIASWIVLRNTKQKDFKHFIQIFGVISIAGSLNLLLVLVGVLQLQPLYQPMFVIPIAGMIYANAMQVLALFIERYESERRSHTFVEARAIAMKAAMIPQVNALLAVGLVSLPGMMSGQILSGIDPLVAVRYQIVVMLMILSSAGFSVILYSFIEQSKQKV